MFKKILFISIFCAGCSQTKFDQPEKIELGNSDLCAQYSGLPPKWGKDNKAGMSFIKGGEFKIGNNFSYPEEKALLTPNRKIEDFWVDRTEVTNAQFESFVKATGYITQAEQQGEAAVFIPDSQAKELGWWKLIKGANWKVPNGPNDKQPVNPNEPVRMVTLSDALAYAQWLGRDLPSEEQWEYLARLDQTSNARETHHEIKANIWEGHFPYENNGTDGYVGVAPVGCFPSNQSGVFDMIGNVWEYTKTPFYGSHDDHMGMSQISNKSGSLHNLYTIKGGSYLCAANYCHRYTSTARQPQESDLAISHVGFRTVLNLK